jgi:hypothetical protein
LDVRPHPTDIICPGEASGNPKARVPWASLLEWQDDFLDDEFLLDDLELKEPSKIHRNDITRIITHWKERQDDQEVAIMFWFKKVQGQDKNLICAVLPHSERASGASGPSGGKIGKGTGKGKGKGKRKQAEKAHFQTEDSELEEDEIRQALNDVDANATDQEDDRDRESLDKDADWAGNRRPDQQQTRPDPNEAGEHRQVLAQKALPKPKPKSMLKPTVHRCVQPESDREADRPNPRKSQRIPPAALEPTTPRPKPKPAYKKAQPVEPRVTRSSEKRTADGDPEGRSSKKQKSNTGPVEEEADPDRNKKRKTKGSKYVCLS